MKKKALRQEESPLWKEVLSPEEYMDFRAIGDSLIIVMAMHADLAEFEVLARRFNESAKRGAGTIDIYDYMVDLKPHIHRLNSKLARSSLAIRTLLSPPSKTMN